MTLKRRRSPRKIIKKDGHHSSNIANIMARDYPATARVSSSVAVILGDNVPNYVASKGYGLTKICIKSYLLFVNSTPAARVTPACLRQCINSKISIRVRDIIGVHLVGQWGVILKQYICDITSLIPMMIYSQKERYLFGIWIAFFSTYMFWCGNSKRYLLKSWCHVMKIMQWMTNKWKTSQNIRIAKVMFNCSCFICCSVRNGPVI